MEDSGTDSISIQSWPAAQLSQIPLDTCAQLAQLFHDTVHQINCKDYRPEQLAAWSPSVKLAQAWRNRLQFKQTLYIAVQGDRRLGFAELDPPESEPANPEPAESDPIQGDRRAHLDCFYVHHQHQGQGIATALLASLENEARTLGISLLYVEASITAQPFFSHRGFEIVREQTKDLRGCRFKQFYMEKPL